MLLSKFVRSEEGAVTTDWVVLSAATIGLGAAAVGAVSGSISNISWDVRPNFSVSFSVLEGADGVEIITEGGARVDGSNIWLVGGSNSGGEIVFGPETLGEGITTLQNFATTAALDWGRLGGLNEPLAIRFGDQDTAQGGFGTALDEGVTLLLEPANNGYSILWNGTELDSGEFDYNMVDEGSGGPDPFHLLSVSDNGTITFNDGSADPVSEIEIPDNGWWQANREGWSLSYSSERGNGAGGWLRSGDFTLSGYGY